MIFNREEQHLILEGSVLSKEDVKRLVACYTCLLYTSDAADD